LKFSYQWLAGLVPDLKTGADELQRLITMKTAECEGIEPVGSHFASVVAARVLTVSPLAKGKNKSVSIDVGMTHPKQVVCGAPNVRPGILVPWVPPGTSLNGKPISTTVIEGVESEGMLASAAELGINRDHSGLLELAEGNPGLFLDGLAPDWIIEIDNKSLTHRPDLWGHYGMAREVAAFSHNSLRDPVDLAALPQSEAVIPVRVEDFTFCPRYSALLLENVQVATSPLWLQARLTNIGLNPINNIVDITNYVLAELPQPMHAFDADKLRGTAIIVRSARPGEKLAALNGETYELTPADLVIADEAGPIALAGVIGGAASAISESTTRVVLESANFQPGSVRLSSARHKLRTDASMRFEKSLDPENTIRGLARAAALLRQICPGIRMESGPSDQYQQPPLPKPIPLAVDFVCRKLGIDVSERQVTDILRALGFGVAPIAPGRLTVTIPTWRATKDISLKDDLVEEIGRMIGYGEITPAPPLVASVPPPQNPMRLYLRQVRRELADQGFTEVSNYSFVNQAEVARFSLDIADHIAIRNPIASELTHLRRSLLPGLFSNIINNVRHLEEFRIFEIGAEVHPIPDAGLPRQVTHGGAVLYSLHADEQDFFELKRVAECLFPNLRLQPTAPRPYEHPTRTAEMEWDQTVIGRIFELHPSLLRDAGVEGRAMFFDVDLEMTQQIEARKTIRYHPLRKYPTSGFDLSVVADLQLPVATIQDHLARLAGSALAQIEFVRQYAGPPLAEGQKSVSYHLEVGALDHTLTAEEAMEVRNRIIDGMQKLGFELRV
jgi:phenylalanyl-tRNA synthetase beta chain